MSLAQQPANADLTLAAGDLSAGLSNHKGYNVIVSNITYYSAIFLSFGSCFQNPLGSKI